MDANKKEKLMIFASCLFKMYQNVSIENDNTADTIKGAIKYLRPMMSREDVRKFFINSAERIRYTNKELLTNLVESESFTDTLRYLGEDFSRLEKEFIVDTVNDKIYEARIKNVDNIMEEIWKSQD